MGCNSSTTHATTKVRERKYAGSASSNGRRSRGRQGDDQKDNEKYDYRELQLRAHYVTKHSGFFQQHTPLQVSARQLREDTIAATEALARSHSPHMQAVGDIPSSSSSGCSADEVEPEADIFSSPLPRFGSVVLGEDDQYCPPGDDPDDAIIANFAVSPRVRKQAKLKSEGGSGRKNRKHGQMESSASTDRSDLRDSRSNQSLPHVILDDGSSVFSARSAGAFSVSSCQTRMNVVIAGAGSGSGSAHASSVLRQSSVTLLLDDALLTSTSSHRKSCAARLRDKTKKDTPFSQSQQENTLNLSELTHEDEEDDEADSGALSVTTTVP